MPTALDRSLQPEPDLKAGWINPAEPLESQTNSPCLIRQDEAGKLDLSGNLESPVSRAAVFIETKLHLEKKLVIDDQSMGALMDRSHLSHPKTSSIQKAQRIINSKQPNRNSLFLGQDSNETGLLRGTVKRLKPTRLHKDLMKIFFDSTLHYHSFCVLLIYRSGFNADHRHWAFADSCTMPSQFPVLVSSSLPHAAWP